MPTQYATVALPRVPKALTYRLEAAYGSLAQPGSLVRVPLGLKAETGVIISLTNDAPKESFGRIKSIYEVLWPAPILTPDLIELSLWLATYYAASLGSVIETVIPSAIRQGAREKISKNFIFNESFSQKFQDNSSKIEELKLGAQQKILLEKISELPAGTPISFSQLKAWNISPSIAHALVKKEILKISSETVHRSAYDDHLSQAEIVSTAAPALSPQQQTAVDIYEKLLNEKNPEPQLLHGVTGSGKTEVYLRLIQKVLDRGGSALMLVPEVALTPQMIGRLRGRFGQDPKHCIVWHSHLSSGERTDAYRAMVSGECKIVVGARSALFSPLKDLQLIIVDEEHEMAYKQEEAPRYHARDAALMRAQLCGALCIMGSATPSLEAIHLVRQGHMGLTLMTKRIDDRPMPLVHVVDLRRSLGKTPWLSTLLKEKLTDRLEKGEQALFFLNRRGHSSSFLCTDCGYVAMCHQCSIAMTYHAHIEKLRCHMCGTETNAPKDCPSCHSAKVRWRGVGTQKIEASLKSLFPKARIARVDSDALTTKNTLREIFADFRRGKLDVLIGTQMIAKGLDFPNVTLVGMVDADLSLHQPDFRAAERTFQLLVQVAGRAGRGDRSGEVVVQTFLPHSSTLQYARHVDTDGFIEEELEHRRAAGYPPYRHLILHMFRSPSLEKLSFYCEAWARLVTGEIPEIEVRGPTPAPIERIENIYRYQLWYLCKDIPSALTKINNLRQKFTFDKDITETLDVDATQLM